jgi:hypothetical protein
MTQTDPTAAQLARIEAELAAQDNALEGLRSVALAYGEIELAVPRADLDEIEEACAPQRAVRLETTHTGIRC